MNSGFFAVLASLAARTIGRHLPHRETRFESFWDEYIAPLLAICVLSGIVFVVGFVIFASARANYKSDPPHLSPNEDPSVHSMVNGIPSGESLDDALSKLDEGTRHEITVNSQGVDERLSTNNYLVSSYPSTRCLILSNPQGQEVEVSSNSGDRVTVGRTPLLVTIPAHQQGFMRSLYLGDTEKEVRLDSEIQDQIVRF